MLGAGCICCDCTEATLYLLPDLVFLSVDVLAVCAGVAPVIERCCLSHVEAGGCGTVNIPILNLDRLASKFMGAETEAAARLVGGSFPGDPAASHKNEKDIISNQKKCWKLLRHLRICRDCKLIC